jgi:hypothetical protein
MSGWNWALVALSEQSSNEISLAGMQIATEMASAQNSYASEAVEMPVTILKDDASHVLKVYYDAQPS